MLQTYFTQLCCFSLCCAASGAWKYHGKTRANLPCESSPYGPWLGIGAGSILQGGAHPKYGPCGQGDHHGGAADLQASQETGFYT